MMRSTPRHAPRGIGLVPAIFAAILLWMSTAGTTVTVAGGQDEWPQFRGPAAGVVADDPRLPDTWSETENVLWKIDLPGLSWSSPVVSGDLIFVTSAISTGEEPPPIKGLYDPGEANGSARPRPTSTSGCSDRHRRPQRRESRWQRELQTGAPPMKRHLKNSFASETPVTDGRRVYVYFGSIGLVAAFNMSGETVWTREIDVYNTLLEMGTAASPVLHRRPPVCRERQHDPIVHGRVRYRHSGDEIWRVARDEQGQNWATPVRVGTRAPHRARHVGHAGCAVV